MDEIQGAIARLEARGWTLAAIADELGTHRETVARWKAGSRAPHNARGVLLMLHALERRQRVPKRKRYTVPRKGRGAREPGAG